MNTHFKLLPLLILNISFCLAAFTFSSCARQDKYVKLLLNKIPGETPAADTIFVAGSFNNWNPSDPAYSLQKTEKGQWELLLPLAQGGASFKFTRGSWQTVETDSLGGDVPNRSLEMSKAGSVVLRVEGWKDQLSSGAAADSSTAAANVKILSSEFAMPQLGRTRRIWIYLPPDYATSNKHYPVLYMHDGQNLFDKTTSFSGEWGVDETINRLVADGQSQGVIVVGIDNGGDKRIAEYAPWQHAKHGGGEGAAYTRFLVETLKPYIDLHYRTLPEQANTGLAGSSLGGLISLYAALEYPQVFGRIGIFSPAFWFNPEIFAHTSQKLKPAAGQRFYFIASQRESEEMVPHMQQVYKTMQKKGVAPDHLFYKDTEDGAHSEWYWQREFPAAFLWLMKE